jgi:hypothetical protein
LDETLDFWSEPFHVGQPVDIHVTPANYDNLAHSLKSAGIQHHIKVEDLGRAIEEVRTSIDLRRERTKNQKAFDFENYHTYEEVKHKNIIHLVIKGCYIIIFCYRLLAIWKTWPWKILSFLFRLSAGLTRIVV